MIERTPASEEERSFDMSSEELGYQERAGNYLAELLSQAENAYTMYRQAQKEVASGYKKQEQQLEKNYREAEKRANEALERALDRARKVREQAEQQAEEEFKGALAKAEADYQQSTAEAMKTHKSTLEQAWHKCNEAREEAWRIFKGIDYIETEQYFGELRETPTRMRIRAVFGEKAVEGFQKLKVYW